MRYFECLTDQYAFIKRGEIKPEHEIYAGATIGAYADTYKQHWQERSESQYYDYLEQKNRRKPIREWHGAIDAIKDERFDAIPDHLWQSIYVKLTEENNRRWAVQNGYFKGEK